MMSETMFWVGEPFNLYFLQIFISGAQNAGLVGGLVKTGKYRDGDEDKFPEKPDFVFESLLEMAKKLSEL